MLLFSPRWLFLYPGLVLFAFGICSPCRSFGPSTRQRALDIHTLLVAGFSPCLGYQMVLFALFTKIFAIRAGSTRISAAGIVVALVTLEVGLAAACSWC